MIETDVLIVGCGPAGLSAAALLARQGLGVISLTKHRQLAPTPRAHVTNQRTFEVLRDLGLEDEAIQLATPYSQMPNQVFLQSLASVEYGRVRGLLLDDSRNANASPCAIADLPQHLLEPILFRSAVHHGAQVRFSAEMMSFSQDEDGVTAEVQDHLTGERMSVRARYMLGADGGRSRVAQMLALPFTGPGKIGSSLNILFTCDLSEHVSRRPGLLYFIIRSPQDVGGSELGILRCIKPWNQWLLIKGYEAGQETPRLSELDAAGVVREYLGLPGLDVIITGVDPWDLNSSSADVYQKGRVFCLGDAVHRHPPPNGLGSNTAIQDAFNLAWKIDMVLKRTAGDNLLTSYSEERVPIGREAVRRATSSMESYGPIINAVLSVGASADDSAGNTTLTSGSLAGSRARAGLKAALHEKVYEFQARGFELNQLYRSSAILSDGQEPTHRYDPELFAQPTTNPGARVPHAWVQRDGCNVSTLDLVGKGRFTLITGIDGTGWSSAAEAVAARFGIEISVISIGYGCEVDDLYFEWAERREIEDDGCLLVRPDQHVAWRCIAATDGRHQAKLYGALADLLDNR